jgi:uncharacterized integral membrane protein
MTEGRTLYQKIRLVVVIVLAVAVLIIVFQNMDAIDTRVLMWKFEMPRAAMMFGALAVGFVMGALWNGLLRKRG